MGNYCYSCLEENYSKDEINDMVKEDNDEKIVKDGIKEVETRMFEGSFNNLEERFVCFNDNNHNIYVEEYDSYCLDDYDVLSIG